MSISVYRGSVCTVLGLLAAIALACCLVVLSGGPARAAAYQPFNQLDGQALYIDGTIAYSGGRATITGTGHDEAADGYGPYLLESIYYSGRPAEQVVKACAAGAGHSCPIPSYTTASGFTVTKIVLQACAGKSGPVYKSCGAEDTYTP